MARGELDGPTAMDFKRNRVGPSSADLLPDKVAAHAPLQEAQATAKAPPDSSKIRSVSCDAGRCAPQNLKKTEGGKDPEALRPRIVGYEGHIDVSADGHIQHIESGGLGGMLSRPRTLGPTADAPASRFGRFRAWLHRRNPPPRTTTEAELAQEQASAPSMERPHKPLQWLRRLFTSQGAKQDDSRVSEHLPTISASSSQGKSPATSSDDSNRTLNLEEQLTVLHRKTPSIPKAFLRKWALSSLAHAVKADAQNDLTFDQRLSLTAYTGGAFQTVNSALRSNAALSPE